jgi:adenosylcobinamide-phosphate guanylyltransferase
LIAVVMAGGRATRFSARVEKALLEVGGKTLLLRAVEALRVSGVDEIWVAVTPHTPGTKEEAERMGLRAIETRGEGYHEDVIEILERRDVFLTLNVDVPFVSRTHVERLLEAYDDGSVAAVTTESCTDSEPDAESTCVWTDGRRFVWVGLNVVTSDPETKLVLLDDPLLAVNVNDEGGLELANRLASDRGI